MTRYIVDITRFISRIGRGRSTGIDRVETAYISELSIRDPECLAFAKIGRDFIVLKAQDVVFAINELRHRRKLGHTGFRDFYRLKLPKEQRDARQYFRSVSIASRRSAKAVLSGHNLDGVEYVNVGHSNLTDDVLSAATAAGCKAVSVMIHDMIPLDYPEFTKTDISEKFEKRMRSAARYGTRIICNSTYTEQRVKQYFKEWNSSVETIVAHLGVEPMCAVHDPKRARPTFVSLGTIEPRKNHMLLFQVWQKLAQILPLDDMPHLHIIGRRGWKNEEVFKFLDTSPMMDTSIFELSDLDDAQLSTQLEHCAGLLFPSFVEGYGLPALEAAQMGVPVICSDLGVFHEILGSYAIFIDGCDLTAWAETVQSVAEMTRNGATQGHFPPDALSVPSWKSHFRHVFGDTETGQDFHE